MSKCPQCGWVSDGGLVVPIPPERKEIEDLAYKLWELSGRPQGNADMHWLLAELVLTRYRYVCTPSTRIEKKGNWESMYCGESSAHTHKLLVED